MRMEKLTIIAKEKGGTCKKKGGALIRGEKGRGIFIME